MDWSSAKVFDFTGALKGEQSFPRFNDDVVGIIRQLSDEKLAIIFDTGFGWHSNAPMVVRDHVNFSGFNPLIGRNHPIGPRFPVLQGVYTSDCAQALGGLETAVVAAIKHGKTLNAEDADFMHILGADCYCYNLVPTMIVAAHAGWKVLAIVGPDNHGWQKELLDKIKRVTPAENAHA